LRFFVDRKYLSEYILQMELESFPTLKKKASPGPDLAGKETAVATETPRREGAPAPIFPSQQCVPLSLAAGGLAGIADAGEVRIGRPSDPNMRKFGYEESL
jgi:hypothetical protein